MQDSSFSLATGVSITFYYHAHTHFFMCFLLTSYSFMTVNNFLLFFINHNWIHLKFLRRDEKEFFIYKSTIAKGIFRRNPIRSRKSEKENKWCDDCRHGGMLRKWKFHSSLYRDKSDREGGENMKNIFKVTDTKNPRNFH